MTAVFDAPVGTHLGVELAGVGPQAADVVAPLGRALGRIPATERFARGLDHDGAVQARPVLIRRGEGAHIVRHDALARLDAAVGLVDGRVLRESPVAHAARHVLEQRLHRLRQRGLVVLDRDEVVGLPLDDLLGDGALAAHGVDRERGAPHVERIE